MNGVTRWLRFAKAPIMIGCVLLALMVLLLYLSSRDGQRQFTTAMNQLDSLKALNIRLDASVLPVMLGYRTDFDQVTAGEAALEAAATQLDAGLGTPESDALRRLVASKLAAIEDFKTTHGLYSSAKAVGKETLRMLWNEVGLLSGRGATQQALYNLGGAFVSFIGNPNGHSHASFQQALEAASLGKVAEAKSWKLFHQQALNLLGGSTTALNLMRAVFVPELPQALAAQASALQARLVRTKASAERFRIALFVVGVVLLAFSAAKVIESRRYLRTIEDNSHRLDERVQERTRQLSEANESLVRESAQRERAESQLRIAQKLESIGQLAAGVAHEINTPTQYVSDNMAFLATVWGDIAPLLDDYETRRQSDPALAAVLADVDLDFVRSEVPLVLEQSAYGLRQIGRIVFAMRSFAHPGGETFGAADINKAIEMTAVIARGEWKGRADLVLDLDPDMPSVICDVSAISRVVLNLVVNAAQAIEDAPGCDALGHIRVATSHGDGVVEIVVTDDGPGVPEGIRDRIFDPFFTTKDVGRGTGQGLALAHQVIVQQHEGALTVATAPGGKGASFTIRLPLVPSVEGQVSATELEA